MTAKLLLEAILDGNRRDNGVDHLWEAKMRIVLHCVQLLNSLVPHPGQTSASLLRSSKRVQLDATPSSQDDTSVAADFGSAEAAAGSHCSPKTRPRSLSHVASAPTLSALAVSNPAAAATATTTTAAAHTELPHHEVPSCSYSSSSPQSSETVLRQSDSRERAAVTVPPAPQPAAAIPPASEAAERIDALAVVPSLPCAAAATATASEQRAASEAVPVYGSQSEPKPQSRAPSTATHVGSTAALPTDAGCPSSVHFPTNTIASVGAKDRLTLVDILNFGAVKATLPFSGQVRAQGALGADRFVAAGESRTVVVYDTTAGCKVREWATTTDVYSVCVADGTAPYIFAAACADTCLRLYDSRTAEGIVRTFGGFSRAVTCCAGSFTSTGGVLYAGSLDCTVGKFDIGMGRGVCKYRVSEPVYSLAYRHTDPYLAVGMNTDRMLVVSITSGQQWECVLHKDAILGLKYAPSGNWLLSVSKDRSAVAWHAPRGPSMFKATEPYALLSCDISPNEQYFVTGGAGKTANLYRLEYSSAFRSF